MEIVGKCPPEKEELGKMEDRGFEKIELYTERKHFDNIEDTLKTVKNSDLEIVSVHTPHVHIDDDKAYFWLADYFCNKLDAYLVFHSQYLHHTHIPRIEEMDIKSNYGYENNPGISRSYLENCILKKGHEMVLDTAHLFMAEEDFYEELEHILEAYDSQIDVMHICDSTKTDDGLAFGEGEMDMERTAEIIADSEFDGILVLEVMPRDQEDALDIVNDVIRG